MSAAPSRFPTRADVTVIGGGLAGCEAAWQLAERGFFVSLVEMKPHLMSPAHQTPLLCELVCSNSLRSNEPSTGPGLLKRELRLAGSMVLACADEHRVPAGSALAVERFGFGRAVTTRLALHPRIRLERRALDALPEGPTILATGPLTGGKLAETIRSLTGGDRLYFYDAIAPIVSAESISPEHSFRASRWDKHGPKLTAGAPGDRADAKDDSVQSSEDGASGCSTGAEAGAEGDYINCPLDREQYEAFVREVLAARKVSPRSFEEPRYFEGCLPIEVLASRGPEVLRHGPMRPVGLTDPRTGRWPYAVVQLRPENRYLSAYNLVGFQTRLAYPEQQRIFRMIPGLGEAEFLRFGSIHRNTYIDAPTQLGPELELRARPDVRVAGLLTGVEGYIESCAMGLLAAWFMAARLRGQACPPPPPTTGFGGLYQHITASRDAGHSYAPTNVNFGLMPSLSGRVPKRVRRQRLSERAAGDFDTWLQSLAQQAA
ncbi:methylenetetrahydrofolate--tRNA-(uracil(54)-C(5))-methyltransferase (FADH(2)-oxidizing) TrmFO [Haliangium ochraceum]|uniref:Methylenetetrahydrofolate--tRNA-(uracil-5-)-methyltransferase TrmFO n=1 Tax=Haliangium ochraceum (strain DSM 14365 / JCM 11303 / SMP-2) TaxID=502025 RepID=D0LRA0_HALO1|nr:methylenetetrahydrofolate--tRNA-(uracil(54)-C(5))-methyltransferase (FADH(2)-oxidizing) TrmFO [Haliangium ochraceum]ACY17128.1 Methylenetetrahydrofolate--tRNA-(uracil-5-)-meth yltransferase(FADH(2)-oxidizing) [Haliangium ochraceum DSM 14365]